MGLRQRPAREIARVDTDASANELGVYVLAGSQFSAIPPADYPQHEEYVRAILEMGSAYRPLWVTNFWRSPNGGVLRRCHHVMGHYQPNPTNPRRLLSGLLLPSHNLYGIEWRNPIYADDMLDGLTDFERTRTGKVLPRYEALSGGVVNGIRYYLWKKRNKSLEQQEIEENAALEQAEAKADEQLKREAIYRKQHDRVQIGEAKGTIARTFVTSHRPSEAA